MTRRLRDLDGNYVSVPSESTFFSTTEDGTQPVVQIRGVPQAVDVLEVSDKNDVVRLRVTDIGAVILPGLPTADPAVAGQLWNDLGTLKVSAG